MSDLLDKLTIVYRLFHSLEHPEFRLGDFVKGVKEDGEGNYYLDRGIVCGISYGYELSPIEGWWIRVMWYDTPSSPFLPIGYMSDELPESLEIDFDWLTAIK